MLHQDLELTCLDPLIHILREYQPRALFILKLQHAQDVETDLLRFCHQFIALLSVHQRAHVPVNRRLAESIADALQDKGSYSPMVTPLHP